MGQRKRFYEGTVKVKDKDKDNVKSKSKVEGNVKVKGNVNGIPPAPYSRAPLKKGRQKSKSPFVQGGMRGMPLTLTLPLTLSLPLPLSLPYPSSSLYTQQIV